MNRPPLIMCALVAALLASHATAAHPQTPQAGPQTPPAGPKSAYHPDQPMTTDSPQAAEVKAEIERLVQAASTSQFEILDRIYHDDMRIYMFDEDRNLHENDKAGFIKHVKESVGAAVTPNIWAKFHKVEANATHGHVLISRKVNLTGAEQTVTLSIDLVYEDGRWQITREVIFIAKGE